MIEYIFRNIVWYGASHSESVTFFEEVDGLYGHLPLEVIAVSVISGIIVASVVLAMTISPSVLVPVLIPPSVPALSQPLCHFHPPLCQSHTHFHPSFSKFPPHVHSLLSKGAPGGWTILSPPTPLLVPLLVPLLALLAVVAASCRPPRTDVDSARHGSIHWRPEALPVFVYKVVLAMMLRHCRRLKIS